MRFKEFKLWEKIGTPAADPNKVSSKETVKDKDLVVGPPYPPEFSARVKDLQTKLQSIGYSVGATGIDGKFGPRTSAALAAFIKDYNLTADSRKVDAKLETELEKVASGVIPKVKNPTPVNAGGGKAGSFGTPVPVTGSDDAKAIKSVINAGPGFTDVQTVDGKTFRRQGTRNWRNNNPGNLEYGAFARSKGAVGTDGRFAVFPTLEAGMKAKEDLVFGPSYVNLSIRNAIKKYAPESENDVNMYVGQIVQATGASEDTVLKNLNSRQRQAMLDKINQVEGFKVGQVFALKDTGTATA